MCAVATTDTHGEKLSGTVADKRHIGCVEKAPIVDSIIARKIGNHTTRHRGIICCRVVVDIQAPDLAPHIANIDLIDQAITIHINNAGVGRNTVFHRSKVVGFFCCIPKQRAVVGIHDKKIIANRIGRAKVGIILHRVVTTSKNQHVLVNAINSDATQGRL